MVEAHDVGPEELLDLARKLEAAIAAEDRIGTLITMNRLQIRILLRHGHVDPRGYDQDHPDEETPG